MPDHKIQPWCLVHQIGLYTVARAIYSSNGKYTCHTTTVMTTTLKYLLFLLMKLSGFSGENVWP